MGTLLGRVLAFTLQFLKIAFSLWLVVCLVLLYAVGVIDSIWDEIVQFFLRRKYELEDLYDSTVEFSLPYIDSVVYTLKAGRVNSFVHTWLLRTRRVECPICLEDVFPHRTLQLKSCDHVVCISCLESSIQAELEQGKAEFSCPLDEDCDYISVSQVNKAIRLNRRLQERVQIMYVRTALQGMEAVFRCPSVDCKNAVFSEVPLEEESFKVDSSVKQRLRFRVARFTRGKLGSARIFLEGEGGGDMRQFKCGECGNSYCVLCSKVWQQDKLSHKGISCDNYKERRKRRGIPDPQLAVDREFKRMVRDGIVRKCPRCGEAIVKNGGCSHMHCRTCKTDFCWRCNKIGCRGNCRYI